MKSEETKRLLDKVIQINKIIHKSKRGFEHCNHAEFRMMKCINEYYKHVTKKNPEIPGITVSNLSKYLGSSKPATSKMLNTLEGKGFIERIMTKSDRRAVYIVLTDQGMEVCREVENYMDTYMNDLLDKLGEEDTTAILRIMDRLYEIIREKESIEKKEDE